MPWMKSGEEFMRIWWVRSLPNTCTYLKHPQTPQSLILTQEIINQALITAAQLQMMSIIKWQKYASTWFYLAIISILKQKDLGGRKNAWIFPNKLAKRCKKYEIKKIIKKAIPTFYPKILSFLKILRTAKYKLRITRKKSELRYKIVFFFLQFCVLTLETNYYDFKFNNSVFCFRHRIFFKSGFYLRIQIVFPYSSSQNSKLTSN